MNAAPSGAAIWWWTGADGPQAPHWIGLTNRLTNKQIIVDELMNHLIQYCRYHVLGTIISLKVSKLQKFQSSKVSPFQIIKFQSFKDSQIRFHVLAFQEFVRRIQDCSAPSFLKNNTTLRLYKL